MISKELKELILDNLAGFSQGRYLKIHRGLNQAGLVPTYYQKIEPAHVALCLFVQATFKGGEESMVIRWTKTLANGLKVMEDRNQLHAVNVLAGIIGNPAIADRVNAVLIDAATGMMIVEMIEGDAIQTHAVWPLPDNYHIQSATRITGEFLRHLAAELEGVEDKIINQIFQN
jgi:hypothetical protein